MLFLLFKTSVISFQPNILHDTQWDSPPYLLQLVLNFLSVPTWHDALNILWHHSLHLKNIQKLCPNLPGWITIQQYMISGVSCFLTENVNLLHIELPLLCMVSCVRQALLAVTRNLWGALFSKSFSMANRPLSFQLASVTSCNNFSQRVHQFYQLTKSSYSCYYPLANWLQ